MACLPTPSRSPEALSQPGNTKRSGAPLYLRILHQKFKSRRLFHRSAHPRNRTTQSLPHAATPRAGHAGHADTGTGVAAQARGARLRSPQSRSPPPGLPFTHPPPLPSPPTQLPRPLPQPRLPRVPNSTQTPRLTPKSPPQTRFPTSRAPSRPHPLGASPSRPCGARTHGRQSVLRGEISRDQRSFLGSEHPSRWAPANTDGVGGGLGDLWGRSAALTTGVLKKS